MLLNDLESIEAYINDLQRYSSEQLTYVSEAGVWSLGQMYCHLIEVALEYLEHVEACAAATIEQPLGKTEAGEDVYRQAAFPPIRIKLPDLQDNPSNLESKETLTAGLEQVAQQLQVWEKRLDTIHPQHKIKHDGFGWLNARDWFELVGMHFRHHLRQKEELEQRLPS